ncbi:MAG: orotidine-5'-phosphate decarboxylase [Verrucomicrobiales bacterium]|nr:orotidine-5'-phosphate decarboxylase [Verrucomicrobiales bacterium]
MSYRNKLTNRIQSCGTNLCVGIDPRPGNHPGGVDEVRQFCVRLIDETAEFAAAFKPNIAYFEAMGVEGYKLLEELLGQIWSTRVPSILDAKRGDIGATQEHYAQAYFENWDVDAVTLSPYMGYDSVEPFLGFPGKGVYLLGVTSNPGAADIETQKLDGDEKKQVFQLVGEMAEREPDQIGLVMGLTNLSKTLLKKTPDVPLLIPGLGAQGGDLATLAAQKKRTAPWVVNVSRGIMYNEPDRPFSEKAGEYAKRIRETVEG